MNLFLLFMILFASGGNPVSDTSGITHAERLEQTGRDYFAKSDFKQAIHYLQLSKDAYDDQGNSTEAAKMMQNIGLAYLMTADFEQAGKYLREAETEFMRTGNQEQLVYCQNNLGLVNYYKGDFPAALDYYKRAAELFEQVGDPDEYAELINRTGMTYWSMGMHDKALQYLHDYTSRLDPENPKKQAIGYNNLGAIYKETGNLEKALDFYRKAADYYLLANDSLDLPSPLTNIGTILSVRGQHDSALHYYNISLEISDKMGDRLQTAKTKHNIALIYKAASRFAEAEDLLREYLETSRGLGYKEGIAQAGLSMGNLFRDMKNDRQAIRYYNDCIHDASATSLAGILMQAHKNLSAVYREAERFDKALTHFQEYVNLKDTLLSKEKAKIIAELETRYETEKKEQENILLMKDNELKDKTINTLYLILAAIIGISLSFIFMIILYRRNALNKKRLAESEAARLSERIEYQSREMASSALALSRNLTFIKNILVELKALSPHVDDVGLNVVRSISRTIQHLDHDPAWEEFELRFREVHNLFYEKLAQRFPSLTANEIRLCALLKLGMNTKEISSVTFQNIRAIEAARLRLRKKLGMESNEGLSTFLQKL
jgi:tetratricopeptide (TPR) repeat protein